jgi:hypothetical protein
LPPHQSGFVVVRSDKGEPLAGGRIGIDRDYRNALRDSSVDIRLHYGRIGCRNHDARRLDLLGQDVPESVGLSLGIEGIGSHQFGFHS